MKSTTLKFKEDEWKILEKISKQNGYSSVYSFLMDQIRTMIKNKEYRDLEDRIRELEEKVNKLDDLHFKLYLKINRLYSEINDIKKRKGVRYGKYKRHMGRDRK